MFKFHVTVDVWDDETSSVTSEPDRSVHLTVAARDSWDAELHAEDEVAQHDDGCVFIAQTPRHF